MIQARSLNDKIQIMIDDNWIRENIGSRNLTENPLENLLFERFERFELAKNWHTLPFSVKVTLSSSNKINVIQLKTKKKYYQKRPILVRNKWPTFLFTIFLLQIITL